MLRTPLGTDILSIGAISIEIPSKDVIHAQTSSGLAANVTSNESVVLTASPMRLTLELRSLPVRAVAPIAIGI